MSIDEILLEQPPTIHQGEGKTEEAKKDNPQTTPNGFITGMDLSLFGEKAAAGDSEASPSLAPPTEEEKKQSFFNLPTGQATNLIFDLLAAGANATEIPQRRKEVSKREKYSVTEQKQGDRTTRQVTLISGDNTFTVEITDALKAVRGSNSPAKNLFFLTLIKANEQAIHDGELKKDYISFALHELIDLGLYSSLRSARTGFDSARDVLTSMKVKGHIQLSKKAGNEISSLEVLFTGARRENGQCTVFLNPRMMWGEFITQYFTPLPNYFFSLSNRAQDLLYYIFFLARMNTDDIEERGYFTISLKAIQQKLNLPSETDNRRPKQTIKDPIQEAIAEIQKKHKKQYNNNDLTLTIKCKTTVPIDSLPIDEYLRNGYLEIQIKGNLSKRFTEFEKKKERMIQKAEAKRARIEEIAKGKNLAKKYEAEDQAEGATNNSSGDGQP